MSNAQNLLVQLEVELERCQAFLNSRDQKGIAADIQLEKNIQVQDLRLNAGSSSSKPKTFNELLNYLESAPEGPVELDPHLLYSPRSSTAEDDETASQSDENMDFSFKKTSTATTNHRNNIENLFYNKTYPSKQRSLQRLQDLRGEKQREELAECTFVPQTGRPPKQGGPHAQLQQHLKVEERLLLAAGHRKNDAVCRLKAEREEAERAECTFKPQCFAPPSSSLTHTNTHTTTTKPIHQRLNDEWRRKEEALAAATAKADADVSFKPEINPVSIRLAAKRRCQGVEQRPRRPPASSSSPEPTFHPSINPVSARMLEMSSTLPSDFHRRQRHFQRQRDEHRHALAASTCTEAGVLFHPTTTGSATTLLALSDHRFEQAVERPEERWERMAVVEAEQREERLRDLEAHVREQEATFAPRLNPHSLRLARDRQPLIEAVVAVVNNNTTTESSVCRAMKECTFFPNTQKPRVVGYYDEYMAPTPNARLSIAAAAAEGPEALSKRIEEHRLEKERRAEAARATNERKQLAQCTFAPDLSKSTTTAAAMRKYSSPSLPVAGMDRYLEIKALAERKQAELDARAEKVFNLKPRSRGGATVPKPFNLASEARSQDRRSEKH